MEQRLGGGLMENNKIKHLEFIQSTITRIGYIPVVKWEDFKYNCDTYLNKALQAKKDVLQYKICKTV